MTKPDIIIHWGSQLLIVRSVDYEITAQSLVNKISEEQASLINTDKKVIADYTGKQPLAGGVKAPIVITLMDNWRIKFERIKETDDFPRICRLTEGLIGREDGQDPFFDADNLFSQNIVSLHQKFNILASTTQFDIDFKKWTLRCASERLPISLCYFDIDHFDKYNHKYTETIIDERLLIPYQRYLKEVIYPHAAIYSEGGDEFVILFPGRNIDSSKVVCDTILECTRVNVFDIGPALEKITISMGLADALSQDSIDHLKLRANQLKQKAKEQGRNQLIFK